MSTRLTGGCQCGAVRFACERLGRASICHCRMCQKAFGNLFAPLVTAHDLVWTRGAPTWFQSSARVRRGFCAACGTPLTYQYAGSPVDVAICALDTPDAALPVIQVGTEGKRPWCDALPSLPEPDAAERARAADLFGGNISYQHPDCDTADWPPRTRAP